MTHLRNVTFVHCRLLSEGFVEIWDLNAPSLHVLALVVLKGQDEVAEVTDTLRCCWLLPTTFVRRITMGFFVTADDTSLFLDWGSHLDF